MDRIRRKEIYWNKEEDLKYWALKKQADEFEAQFATLQKDKSSLDHDVKE
jgi:hypothetical protein